MINPGSLLTTAHRLVGLARTPALNAALLCSQSVRGYCPADHALARRVVIQTDFVFGPVSLISLAGRTNALRLAVAETLNGKPEVLKTLGNGRIIIDDFALGSTGKDLNISTIIGFYVGNYYLELPNPFPLGLRL